MPAKALRVLVLLAALVPSAWFAWKWRSLPHASEYHDDGIYYVNAKSLAESGSFRIESFPGAPPQTKFPPLWPAVLSLAWLWEARYPDNLPLAMLLCWIWLPCTVFLYRRWLHEAGFTEYIGLALAAVWALSPYVILFSTVMLSEMLFVTLLLGSLLCLRRPGPRWAAAAGALAGLSFLARTAGIALLPAGILLFVLERRWRDMGCFAAAMLPAVFGWFAWSSLHRLPSTDSITMYYVNYFGYYLAIFEWREAHLYAWKNIDGMLRGLGALLLPDTTRSLLDKILAQTLAIGGIIGAARLVRQKRDSIYIPYAAFSVVYAALLVIWHFPPNERLMLPVAPLWLAGLYTELRRLAENIMTVFRKSVGSQKIAGGVLLAGLGGVLLLCGIRQWDLLTTGLPRFYEEHAERLEKSEPAMAWIRQNVPQEAKFLTENDPLLYLRTGRQGMAMMLTTIHWYREDHEARTADHANAAHHAKAHGVEYFLLNEWDYSRDMPEEEHQKVIKALRSDPRLEMLFQSGPSAIYRVR